MMFTSRENKKRIEAKKSLDETLINSDKSGSQHSNLDLIRNYSASELAEYLMYIGTMGTCYCCTFKQESNDCISQGCLKGIEEFINKKTSSKTLIDNKDFQFVCLLKLEKQKNME